MSVGDDEIGQLITAGRVREALEALVKEHDAAVYTRCLRIVRDRDIAREVTQQTFLGALRDLDRFERRSSYKTWLLGIATHRSIDAMRAAQRQKIHTADVEQGAENEQADGPDPHAAAEQRERWEALLACLDGVSGETVAALLLRYRDELSYEEMSIVLGEKPGTLQARVARAIPVLRDCMSDKGFTA